MQGGMEMVYGVTLSAIIVGVIEVFKKLGLPHRWCPLIALILGILVGVFYVGEDVKEGILIGISIGLSSCGLYSGVKNTIGKS